MSNDLVVTLKISELEELIKKTVSECLITNEECKRNSQNNLVLNRKDYITREELQALLKKSHSTISEYIKEGLLIQYKYTGNTKLFKLEDVFKTFPKSKL